MPRYVILLHELPPDHALGSARTTHWDLMLEWDGQLRTWALDEPPAAACTCRGEQLADHRLQYLDYEGPVSGNRGHVQCWDRGRYTLVSETIEILVVELHGMRLQTRATLQRSSDGHFWVFSTGSEPIRG